MLAAEYLVMLTEALPTLTFEELRFLPFEAADALASASAVRRRLKIQEAAIAGSASVATMKRLDSEIQTIRTGVEEFKELAQHDVVKDALNEKYGRPIAPTSDMGLAALGLVRKEED